MNLQYGLKVTETTDGKFTVQYEVDINQWSALDDQRFDTRQEAQQYLLSQLNTQDWSNQ
jgi:hypothetical protein